MGLTGILLIIILGLFVITIKFVTDGIRSKNWKKVTISVIIFLAIILLVYFGLLRLITSM